MAILVGGEALFDLVHESPLQLRAHAGGGPYNTARTLGRLERDVHYLGCLSGDGFGAQLRSALAEDGVKLDTVVETSLPTTLALAELDAGGSATYRFYTEGTSAPSLEPEAALAVLPGDVEMLHVGTLCLVMEPTAIALQAVVEAVSATALVMVDPNCRPTFIPDQGTYRRSLAATLQYVHVVKVSMEDLDYLEPGRPPAEAARALLDEGPSVALVTAGGEGALVITADAELRVPAPAARVVDTIGAGDAFGGGFLGWWSLKGLGRDDLADSELVREATRFACVVAARTCERPGAQPPRLAEVSAAA
jgi:fructokinase